jgi:hypothetical protein
VRARVVVMFSVMALLTAACGGGDGAGGTTSPANQSETSDEAVSTTSAPGGRSEEPAGDSGDQGDSEPSGAFPAGGSGSFVVDGETFDGVPVARCEPFSVGEEPNEDDLSLIALIGGMDGLQVELSNRDGFAAGDNEMINYLQQSVEVDYSRSGDAGVEQFSAFASTDQDGNWYLGGAPSPGQTLEAMESAPFNRDGDHVNGAMSLDQDWPDGATGTVNVTFDLEVPSDVVDCSL